MKKERFFITGGLGYIGSYFAREALKKGHVVCLYDSLMYEQNRHRMLNEISEGNPERSDLKMIIGDTRNYELLDSSVKEFKPTYLMHWGDFSSVYSCNHNPTLTDDVCYQATTHVVDLCSDLAIPLFYNSTSSVYGVQPDSQEMTERDPVPDATDQYCKAKLKIEAYIKQKKAVNPDFKVILFRPATVFGLSPRLRIELLPNHFTYMAVSNKVVTVADLNAYRAAIDVEDLVEGYFKVIEKGTWDHLLYNIGHHNISKLEFALGIQKVTGCRIVTIADIGDLRNLQIDCTLFDTEFGFVPKNTYQTSVERVAKWIDSNLEEIERSNYSEMLNMPLNNWLKICK
jgi:nucleoside-diphosphate-sugar epimerase